MSIKRIAPAVVGSVILLSLRLAVYVNGAWRWLTADVGADLVRTAGLGALAIVMKQPGKQPGSTC